MSKICTIVANILILLFWSYTAFVVFTFLISLVLFLTRRTYIWDSLR